MNEPPSPSTAIGGRERRSSAMFRLVLEFILIFAGTMLANQILAASVVASYPNLLWLPVILLTLQHGFAAGLAAAVVATVLHYWGGLPPASMSEDMYSYIGRVAAEPVGWTSVALLLGQIRSRQIAAGAELQSELAQRSQHCAAVADLCVDLRRRIEMLERHIAADAHSSNVDLAEAMSRLQHAGWDDFMPCLARFVVLMTGAPEFTIYLLQDDALKPALQPIDDHRPGADLAIARDDPMFAAIVNERRVLSVAHPPDGSLLAGRGIMSGPLMDGRRPGRVIGMLAIGGVSLDDCPNDVERRFLLTSSELSRFASRIALIELWDDAGASRSKGEKVTGSETVANALRSDRTPPTPLQTAHHCHVTLQ
jgi:hypothetical protein